MMILSSIKNKNEKEKKKSGSFPSKYAYIYIYIYVGANFEICALTYNQLLSLWFSLSQIRTLSPACVFSMDQRRVATIEFHPQELTVKAKRSSRERVQLPPKRGRIKRQILSGIVHNLMKIMKCGS